MVVSDNGPQYSAEAYARFAREYQFEHITSSPHYPQTVKCLLKKRDPHLALLSYRATLLQSGFSPSELLMSRKLRTNVLVTREVLKPQVPDLSSVRERDERHKTRQQSKYNSRHGARELTPLNPGETFWIPDREQEATVTQEAGTRSFKVQTSDRTYRRNRRALVHLPDSIDGQSDDMNLSANASKPSVCRSSRVTHPPDRLDPSWNIGHL